MRDFIPNKKRGIVMSTRMSGKRLVGAKQTLKAIKNGTAKIVYVAQDAESKVINPIVDLSNQKGVEVVYLESMEKLGTLCGIDVGAATACLID